MRESREARLTRETGTRFRVLYAESELREWLTQHRFRVLGLDVRSGAEERASAPDPDVLATATELGRILITEDEDFGDLVVRRGLAACGVILLRTTPTSATEVDAVAERVIAALPQAEGAMTTLTEEKVRRRPLG